MAKQKFDQIVSPAGVASYPSLDKPVPADAEIDAGKFVTKLVVDKTAPGVKEFVAKINEAVKKVQGDSKKKARSPVADGDERENEDLHGKWIIAFKSKFGPSLVDAKKNELPATVKILAGDEIKCLAQMVPYEMSGNKGITLRLKAVQLIKKNNNGYNAADAFDEEEGFEAEAAGVSEVSDDDVDF